MMASRDPPCGQCGRPLVGFQPCGSREFVPFMETGGNCSNCGHGLPCHPAKPCCCHRYAGKATCCTDCHEWAASRIEAGRDA